MNDDHVPAPIEALIRAVAGGSRDDDQRATTFARGLALGALVGAAIAGSTIWQRRHARLAAPAFEMIEPGAATSAEPESDPTT
jgi:hypothetical protein